MSVNKPTDNPEGMSAFGGALKGAIDKEHSSTEEYKAQLAAKQQLEPAVKPAATETTSNPQPTTGEQPMTTPNQKPITIASFMSLGARLETGSADADTLKVKTIFDEILQGDDKTIVSPTKVTVIGTSRTGTFSVIAVHETRMIGGKMYIGAHAFIMEASLPPLEPNIATEPGGFQVEIPQSPASAVNDNFWLNIGNELRAQTKCTATLRKASYQIIYRETHLDKSNLMVMLGSAMNSIANSFDKMENSREFSLTVDSITKSSNLHLQSRTEAPQGVYIAPNGLPIRSDIRTELSLVERAPQNNQNGVRAQRGIKLASTSVYVDLQYTPPFGAAQSFNGVNSINNQQQGFQPHYLPRIVITEMSTDLALDPVAALMLALVNATTMAQNQGFGIQWRDSYMRGKNNLRNFSAIGYQVPALTTTHQPDLLTIESDDMLRNAMSVVLHKDVTYAVDIEEGSSNFWLLELLIAAGNNVVGANEAFFDYINGLTNGRFYSKLASITGRNTMEEVRKVKLVADTRDRWHAGYFMLDSEKHDLREIDHLAILNLSGGDTARIGDWLNTLDTSNNSLSDARRLDARARIIRQLLPDAKIKGIINRISFEGHFISALIEAVQEGGLQINPTNNLLANQHQTYSRGINDFSSQVVSKGFSNQQSTQLNNGNQQSGFPGWNGGSSWNNRNY